MENILNEVEAVIRNYDLPLRAITPARAKVAIKESVFKHTVGYIYPQVLFVPEHTDLVAAIIGTQDGDIVIGEYRRGLPGCLADEVFGARPHTILPVLLKVTIDSYSRYIPDVLVMSSFFDDPSRISVGAPANIEFTATRVPHKVIFAYIIPTTVPPATWKSRHQTLRKRIGEINIPQEWMNLDDAVTFADSLTTEYGLPFKSVKSRRAFLPCNKFGIIIPAKEYSIIANTTALIGIFKSAGGEVPAIAVMSEGGIISLRLTTKSHIVGILFGQVLRAKCNAAVQYTCPNAESCRVTVFLDENTPMDVIYILENGKLMSPSEWKQTLKKIMAKACYISL